MYRKGTRNIKGVSVVKSKCNGEKSRKTENQKSRK